MNFGKNIYELRKKKNVTQDEMAAELGVTAAAVSKWENNYTLPDILMLDALADYFQTTTDELLGRKPHLKYAVVAAASPELGKKIDTLARRYGIVTKQIVDTYQKALDAALSYSEVKYVLVSCEKPLTNIERPAKLYVIESLGQTERQILDGFELWLQHLG